MKKLMLFLLLSGASLTVSFAQNKDRAEGIIDEGVKLHDKGKYEEAIKKYDEALKLDKDNLRAYAEKSYTYLSMKNYYSCVQACKKAIETHPGEKDLQMVYVNYGTCYDEQKNPERAIDVYDEGIKAFPDFYLLHFNKAVTLASKKKYDDAVLCLQKSIQLNPDHPGSHNLLARILDYKGQHVAALMAFCRFFALEPEGARAASNLPLLKGILDGSGSLKKTGKNSMTININASSLKDTTDDGKRIENSFTATELILTMGAVMDDQMKNVKGVKLPKKSDIEKFADRISSVCRSLKESKKDNYGFYWEYYVPYFIEMNDKDLVTTFSYIANASSDDRSVQRWIKSHDEEIKSFYNWSKDFDWSK